jgi:hypothetical protein
MRFLSVWFLPGNFEAFLLVNDGGVSPVFDLRGRHSSIDVLHLRA